MSIIEKTQEIILVLSFYDQYSLASAKEQKKLLCSTLTQITNLTRKL